MFAQRFILARTDIVKQGRCPEVQLMLFQFQIKIGLGKVLVDTERKTGRLNGIHRLVVLVVIMVITYRKITGQTVVEDASPMSRQIHVAIAILLIVVEGKAVTAIVSIDIQLVTHVEGM